ncbi:hypothetical protein Aple_064220 [Acrocarpospora pleiomorpha]|uniref:AAA+ ATPase domain-containing protein n=1 Tax=Acrocarpospora pleiomorpha TaxID=90975 RepID=A0A5M3XW10_9ACTN|nr:hypothetical protein Aple_064220 [Acrocarpospora pleiomorpha]
MPERAPRREWEYQQLEAFAGSKLPGAMVGLVYGRRRQGKSLMLHLLHQQMGGFMFAATQQSERQNLTDLGEAYARFLGLRHAIAFRSWSDALDALLNLGDEQPTSVIIDEFSHLVRTSPALPSFLQSALNPAKRHTRTRLILSGSDLPTMSRLLAANAPLYGRASLDLIVRPFGFRDAAEFWDIREPELAFRVNALVGGTPAYLAMCGGSAPATMEAFDTWGGAPDPEPGKRHVPRRRATPERGAIDHQAHALCRSHSGPERGMPSAVGDRLRAGTAEHPYPVAAHRNRPH